MRPMKKGKERGSCETCTFYVYDEMEGEGIQFYLKMNTRGLALTPFENFRSKYAAYLNTHNDR